MDVSRESGASADQVEETPGRASLEKLGCRTPPQLHAGGVGRQQQHNIQTVYGPTNNWKTVGTHHTRTCPKPVFGKNKSDENLSALPRRYIVVVFNVSSKEEDKVKNYMVSNDVHVVDIKRLSTDDGYVHSFKVVIYRKQAEKVMERKTIDHNNGYVKYINTKL